MRRAFVISVLGAVVSTFAVTLPARADPITYAASFSGKTESLTSDFAFLSNKPFKFSYTFNGTALDANPGDPQSPFYPGTITGGRFRITGLKGGPLVGAFNVSGSNNNIHVQTTPTAHSYHAGAGVIGPSIGSALPVFVSLLLVDRDLEAFASGALSTSIDITDFEWNRTIQFTFLGASPACCATFGTIKKGTIRQVPEPSSMLLLGAGFVLSLGARRARRPRTR